MNKQLQLIFLFSRTVFDFPLPSDIKHKPMDARLLTDVDEEERQEK
jgi:hypothetical protein